MSFADWVCGLFAKSRTGGAPEPLVGTRIHVPLTLRRQLAALTSPRPGRPEPLAVLRARYASEAQFRVVVGVGASPIPEHAYIDASDAGAAFDTRWLVAAANRELRSNVGLFVVHSHLGCGVPKFSGVDSRTNRQVIGRLSIGIDTAPYGAIVLSDDSEAAIVARAGRVHSAQVVVIADARNGGWTA